jgi:hypothetical protein
MNLDLITYGNPTQEQVSYLQIDNYLTPLFGELSKYNFPKNSSEATKEELNSIADGINNLQGKDKFIHRYRLYDRNIFKSLYEILLKDVEGRDELIPKLEEIKEELKPLILKLKYHFQRPRPYQLAQYYKLKLFPFESHSSDSPSFPSGHAFIGRVITEVIGNLYPQTYALMEKVFLDICYSRVYMGIHYQSDIDVGIYCADKVLEIREFKEKYKL